MNTTETIKLMLDALVRADRISGYPNNKEAIQAGKDWLERGREPVAWVGSLKDPQPHCVTNLKYCSVAQWDRGYHLKYIPLYKD
jgi:hypothetical protein